MKVLVAGGTGFVGKVLLSALKNERHTIYILTRNTKGKISGSLVRYIEWNDLSSLEEIDVVINLAGESLNNGRWTKTKKKQILESRVETTKLLVTAMNKMSVRPTVFINASAVGFYGTSLHQTFVETLTTPGEDFLAETVVKWEAEARKAEQLGIRTVLARFGVILGQHEGALPRIVFPYNLYIGGSIGTGRQWISWIHVQDAVRMILFSMHHPEITGPINVTAPTPIIMKDFGKTVANILNKPHWIPVPSVILKVLLGEMSTLVLEGQKVLPHKAIENKFSYLYGDIETALQNLLK